MSSKTIINGLLLLAAGGFVLAACVEPIAVSRGTRIPPEHRGLSSAAVTEAFTKHERGERLSVAATLIDFSYLRAVSRERNRSREVERETYRQYVRRQTTFYVHLVLHGRDSCREPTSEDEEGSGSPLRFQDWTFALATSSGRERALIDVDPGPTQLAPSGGCLVQGYVHFRGNIGSRDEWVELDVSFEGERRLQSRLRWDVALFRPSRRTKRPPRSNRRPPRQRDEAGDHVDDEREDESDDEGDDDFGEDSEAPTE